MRSHRTSAFCLRYLSAALMALLTFLLPSLEAFAWPRSQDPGEEIVVVIDAGHGGSNEGTDSSDVLEKYRTLITAQAMYDELCKYDGVKVYMTRTEDVDMTLKARAQYASSVGADLLVSLHYNASDDHAVFGAEAWVPSTLPLFNYADQFAEIWLSEMAGIGLHLRGVKTRIKEDGTEYYGIIREGKTLGIPVALLEHCYVDAEQDREFCDTEEKEQRLGRADATAVAKYFGLKSTSLGVDYSTMELTVVSVQDVSVMPLGMSTAPEKCTLQLLDQNEETGEVRFKVTAADSDELLEYYEYSIDNGQTWQGISVWPGYDIRSIENRSEATFTVTLPRDRDSDVRVRVYNYYDQRTRSGAIRVHFRYMDEMAEAARAWDEAHDDSASETGTDAASFDAQQDAEGSAQDGAVQAADDGESTDPVTADGTAGGDVAQGGVASPAAQDSDGNAPAAQGQPAGDTETSYNSELAGGIFAIFAVVLLGAIFSVAVRIMRKKK